jgi:protocatechuate 3,4-dioxygenase beta subunit
MPASAIADTCYLMTPALSLSHGLAGALSRRTRHYHVKVQAPQQPVLTTQLYFRTSRATAAMACSGASW